MMSTERGSTNSYVRVVLSHVNQAQVWQFTKIGGTPVSTTSMNATFALIRHLLRKSFGNMLKEPIRKVDFMELEYQ